MTAPGRAARPTTTPLRRAVALLEVSPRRVLVAVLLGTLALGCAVGLAAVSAWLIARASQQPPVLTLSVAVVTVRAFGVGRGTLRYVERLASHDVALRGVARLRENLYARLSTGRAEAVAALREGDLLARTGTDADAVGDVVVRTVVPAGVAVGVSALSVAIVGVLLPEAGVALAATLLVAGVLAPWLADRGAAGTEGRSADARTRMGSAALDVLGDTGPLTVSGGVHDRATALREADRDLVRASDEGARTSAWSAALTTAATGAAVVASLVLGTSAVQSGRLTPVELAVVVLTPLAAFEAVGALPAAAVQLRRSREAAARIMALLDAAEALPARAPVPVAPGPEPVPGAAAPPVLSAQDLAVGHAGTAVLTGVDVDLAAGGTLAVVGPSGVGKTTLLLTLGGLLAPVSGHLVRHADAAWTAEDAHLFDTTVLENLRVARGDVTADEARTALAAVGLTDWLDATAAGLDTRVGAAGAAVSGGERRRLLLARALLADAPVLLVDEPAEHLDPASADAMVRTVLGLARTGRSVVVATHHLGALAAADRVVLLAPAADGGPARVLTSGTHDELLATSADYRWAVGPGGAAP
ncbi:thiol reductant ABC exporter subunit CydC [Luteimicrobium subarcticum]|uniref:ATP-binding cassette subfamily C protein CydC n=1 Tax=Luteimicrobium subarcticum TaxID=620910 RepID=A0A2M8WQT3_9MICO|nr:thiol reductant ABC exporter subunit CydC [Luteimicrobium subarcticum]PJI93273.1 ATP-binding cassette subfamily C protein CydC [Luteimicrobium subarcticum]